MISLLMAFFIMLLTMASGKSGQLCSEGYKFERTMMGFRQTISSYGLAGLLGKPDEGLSFNSPLMVYNVSGGDSNEPGRSLDAEKERIQRIFDQLDSIATAQPSAMQGRHPQFSITPITFAAKHAVLNESAKQYLSNFIHRFSPKRDSTGGLAIYVVGLTPDTKNNKQQWLLAAQRATAAAEFIKSALPADSKIPVCSWGCKKIEELAGLSGKSAQQASILIGTLQSDSAR